MKKSGTVVAIVFFIAAVALSFLAGDYMSDKAHKEERSEYFNKYITIAIDTVEDKGFSLEGASETIVSNLWVAHELCDNPEISAELSNLWNTLVYEEDVYVGQGDTLANQLKDILERCQSFDRALP